MRKKFYLCKLCVIIFGVLASLKNIVADELPKFSATEVDEVHKIWAASVPKKWACLDIEKKEVKVKLVFDPRIESVDFSFKNAWGSWYSPVKHNLLLDQPNRRIYWEEANGTGYLRFTAMNLSTGRMEEHSLRRMIGVDPPLQLAKHGLIIYDCVPI